MDAAAPLTIKVEGVSKTARLVCRRARHRAKRQEWRAVHREALLVGARPIDDAYLLPVAGW